MLSNNSQGLSFGNWNVKKKLESVSFIQRAFATNSGGASADNPGGVSATNSGAAANAKDQGIISNKRQITFVGPRSGEGYFSADGKKLIFQSEREPGNPFYQIFVLDLATGKTERVSPGMGKTTCAWFHPNEDKVLFSSTHLDPEIKKKTQEEYDKRKSEVKSKYSWSFDEIFDIFEFNLRTKKSKRLTQTMGYDAEASYSPDGNWVVFASNRHAYIDTLSEDEKKLFAKDPSSMMEIYLMKSDGTQVKRLTNHLGYDGGPFFSSDGKKITWRRFSANGQSAEIYVMNLDGTEQTAITRLGAMSWAPYFHPSNDYLIFTSNLLGFSNFELFVVDSEGTQKPIIYCGSRWKKSSSPS